MTAQKKKKNAALRKPFSQKNFPIHRNLFRLVDFSTILLREKTSEKMTEKKKIKFSIPNGKDFFFFDFYQTIITF